MKKTTPQMEVESGIKDEDGIESHQHPRTGKPEIQVIVIRENDILQAWLSKKFPIEAKKIEFIQNNTWAKELSKNEMAIFIFMHKTPWDLPETDIAYFPDGRIIDNELHLHFIKRPDGKPATSIIAFPAPKKTYHIDVKWQFEKPGRLYKGVRRDPKKLH